MRTSKLTASHFDCPLFDWFEEPAHCPKGSCRTDLHRDIKRYVEANPKAIKSSSTALYDKGILARLRQPIITEIIEDKDDNDTAAQAAVAAAPDDAKVRRSRRLLSAQDIQYINQDLLRLDQHHHADAKLSNIDHLRDVLTTNYNQDLRIGYHQGHAVINDVIELENNYTETNFDGWRQH